MFSPAEEHEWFFEAGLLYEISEPCEAQRDSEFGLILEDRARYLRCARLQDADSISAMRQRVTPNDGRQRVMCHGGDASDRNASLSKARHILESLDCKRHVVDHPTSLGQEFPSHRRQLHRSCRSIQQTHTKICL
jgi:hypothetical protein